MLPLGTCRTSRASAQAHCFIARASAPPPYAPHPTCAHSHIWGFPIPKVATRAAIYRRLRALVGLRTQTQNAAFCERKGPERKHSNCSYRIVLPEE